MEVSPATRLPVLPQNRAYLKALRQAELAAWESARTASGLSSPSKPASVQLPSPGRDARETRWFALLTVLCGLTVGAELWSLTPAASHWHDFVEFVRRLLA